MPAASEEIKSLLEAWQNWVFILKLILKEITLTWKRDEEQSGFLGGKGKLTLQPGQIFEVKKEKGMRET